MESFDLLVRVVSPFLALFINAALLVIVILILFHVLKAGIHYIRSS